MLLLSAVAALLFLIDKRMLGRVLNYRFQLPKLPAKLLMPVILAMAMGSFAFAGILVLSLPCRVFWPVFVIVLLSLLVSVPRGMLTYHRSLKNTSLHRKYLLGSGGTHLESVIPSVRRGLRATLIPVLLHRSTSMPLAVSLLVLGALTGGATIAAALALGVLAWTAALAASVLTTILAMWMADRVLFDNHERVKS